MKYRLLLKAARWKNPHTLGVLQVHATLPIHSTNIDISYIETSNTKEEEKGFAHHLPLWFLFLRKYTSLRLSIKVIFRLQENESFTVVSNDRPGIVREIIPRL